MFLVHNSAFRVVLHIVGAGKPITLYSEQFNSAKNAELVLDQLLTLPGVTGGGLEKALQFGDEDQWFVFEPETEE